MRLLMLLEGQTEEVFVKEVLAPHLLRFSVVVSYIVVATRRDKLTGEKKRGGGHWKHWKKDLLLWRFEHRGNGVRFTTLFDLYGLPDDFPEFDTYASDLDTGRRAEKLQDAMAKVVADWRFIPYLQRHEFEALVLACLDELSDWLDPLERPGVKVLRGSLGDAGPEDVNDGPETAPSKRLERHIPGYSKTEAGPASIALAGLAVIRSQCPRFDAWLTKLESLGKPTP
jgi:hypothetical protein